ncbi:flagellar basal-body MS-ring/collar protein FliF [Tardiphaga sp. 1201_B9_N1_1]|jgi:flagellar M-ring protein FliF|uniref:flagellar basal-body MS-ring/collar protein FliF n=1 Tax=Tardiphaga TaxID=1395974 RepID=UPI000E769667|nr:MULTISPECIES: flagellar basal-body MS-ring/collar protein FliF [Tardiphaga]NUU44748.1 flagellar M-ring protein FliF [Tardiphaga robiniae]UFS75453.1 flagellar M-ring protein FliF [Tardiphaga sp. 37S4]
MVNREHAQKLWNNLLELGTKRLILLAVVGLAVFGGVGGGAYYISRPEYNVLYSGLSREDVTRVSSVLRDANIAFDLNTAGDTVYVRPGQTAQARTLLADKGLPSTTGGGYELFDKIGSLGLTSFMQEITRVRALEGEIARTIQVLKGVKAARVHIVMPARGSFRREQSPPSASVVLRTDGPADARTARSVRHLVAAAVPGMTADKVTVLDSDGSLLSDDDGSGSVGATPTTMANLQKVVSRSIQENVSRALTPYLGLDNFEVSVATQLSTDKKQTNETVYDPDSRVQRSVRAVREKETSQSLDRQQPTTVQQNLPDQQVNATGAKNQNDEKQRREDITNYEVSSKTVTTTSDGFVVNKMFLAVLVNRPRLIASLGDKVSDAAIEAKVAEISQIAATAAGIDRPRGDQIQVSAVEFMEGARDLAPVPSITFTEVMMRQAGSLVSAITILAVAGMLIWFGLRPAINTILASAKTDETTQFQAETNALLSGGSTMAAAALSGGEAPPNLIQDVSSSMQNTPQKRLEQIIQLDEKQAAAILKQWIRQEEAV